MQEIETLTNVPVINQKVSAKKGGWKGLLSSNTTFKMKPGKTTLTLMGTSTSTITQIAAGQVAFRLASFFTHELPLPTHLPDDIFTESLRLMQEGIQRNAYNHHTGNPASRPTCLHDRSSAWNPGVCSDCKAELSQARVDKETRTAQRLREEDRAKAKAIVQSHHRRIHALAIRVDVLLKFAYAHDCWDWPTWKVVRDIIVPATGAGDRRCRYGDLPELKQYFGPATVFMSHCWSARFGDLVGAACHGARKDRYVWVDIFAVRQWPGNRDDLDFRSVLSLCQAMVVSVSPVDELKVWYPSPDHKNAFLASPKGQAAKKTLPTFRLWCIVEIAAAIERNIAVVVKGGRATKEKYCYARWKSGGNFSKCASWVKNKDGTYNVIFEDSNSTKIVQKCTARERVPSTEMQGSVHQHTSSSSTMQRMYCYDVRSVGMMFHNLERMIDVEASECAVRDDYNREIAVVKSMEGGVDRVNKITSGVFVGAIQSIDTNVLEIDAYVCGEKESLRGLQMEVGCTGEKRELAKLVLIAAGAGGRIDVIHELLAKWSDNNDDDQGERKEAVGCPVYDREGRTVVWLRELIDESLVVWQAVAGGHAGVVGMLLDVPGVNVNIAMNGGTALYTACQNNYSKVVRLLLAREEIDVNQPYDPKDVSHGHGVSPLYIACTYGFTEVVRLLLARKEIDVNQPEKLNNTTPIWIACQEGHTETVQLLLAMNKIDINQSDMKKGNTPFYMACQNGHTPIVKLLLASSEIDVNQARTTDGATSLFLACQQGHAPVVELLLASSDIDVNQARTGDGVTPLSMACTNGHALVVELLLASSDIAVNQALTTNGATPIFIASYVGHVEVVRLLLQHPKIDVHKNDLQGNSAHDMATQKNHHEIVSLLTTQRNRINKDGQTFLHIASAEGAIDAVRSLIRQPEIDFNHRDNQGMTALDYARKNNHQDIVQVLTVAEASANGVSLCFRHRPTLMEGEAVIKMEGRDDKEEEVEEDEEDDDDDDMDLAMALSMSMNKETETGTTPTSSSTECKSETQEHSTSSSSASTSTTDSTSTISKKLEDFKQHLVVQQGWKYEDIDVWVKGSSENKFTLRPNQRQWKGI